MADASICAANLQSTCSKSITAGPLVLCKQKNRMERLASCQGFAFPSEMSEIAGIATAVSFRSGYQGLVVEKFFWRTQNDEKIDRCGRVRCRLSLSAAPVCQLGTLADYVALGSTGCTINDKLFANFQTLHTATRGASAATDATIGVAPIVQAGPAILDPGPGFFFSTGDWTAFAGQTVNSSVRLTVTVLNPNFRLKDASLAFSGGATGLTGAASISETILTQNGGFGMFVGDLPGSMNDVFEDSTVYPNTTTITVLKDIQVKAGQGSFAKISFVEQKFSQVNVIPEPASMALVGGALLLVGLLRRR